MSDPKVPDWVAERLKEEEFMREQLAVTSVDYAESVSRLVRLARGDTSGSRAAAQLLLSLYNGHNWHMDLTDLCVLDHACFQDALIAIRGRVMLFEEPHSVIENGSAVFAELEEDWQQLHTRKRYQPK